MTPIVVFARLLYTGCESHQVAFIWAEVQSNNHLRYHKLLFHAITQAQECTCSIVPHGTGYRWTHNTTTGRTRTFAQAWAYLPPCVTRPDHYHDTPTVAVPGLAAPSLEALWRALPRACQLAIATTPPLTK